MPENNNEPLDVDAVELPDDPTLGPLANDPDIKRQKAELMQRMQKIAQQAEQVQARMGAAGEAGTGGGGLLGLLQRMELPYKVDKNVPAKPDTDCVIILLKDIVDADRRMVERQKQAVKHQPAQEAPSNE